ncbi:MAG TPA: LamG domain-containing protein [Planctomycetota bacterium]|nr:LamG domain-containing protein [Planctomycetota bacterium]
MRFLSKPCSLLLFPLLAGVGEARAQNHALVVDGAGDYVHVSGLTGLADVTQYTLEVWVRSDGPNHANKILDLGEDPNHRITLQGNCLGEAWSVETGEEWGSAGSSSFIEVSGLELCDGAWHHVAKTSDGLLQRVYFDGALVATGPALGIHFDFDGMGLGIGSHIVAGVDVWLGAIDDVRIWRRALAPEELSVACLGDAPAVTTDLVSWWRFEGDALDAVGANHGVLAGAAHFEVAEGCPLGSLSVAPTAISVSTGGVAQFTLDPGPVPFPSLYLLLGSASGTSPGVPFEGFLLPLALDDYFLFSITQANQPPYANSLGVLAPSGTGSATFTVPPATDPALAGLTLHHAAIVWDLATVPTDPTVIHVTNAVALTLVP